MWLFLDIQNISDGVSENPNSLYYYQQNEKEIKNICSVKTEVDKNFDEKENNDKIKIKNKLH